MATTTRTVVGQLSEVVPFLEAGVLGRSRSASAEAAVDLGTSAGGIAVRGYERFSMMGNNRVGMSVTAIQDGPYVHIVGITLGGSQAVFLKLNTIGEEEFLATLNSTIAQWEEEHPGRGGSTSPTSPPRPTRAPALAPSQSQGRSRVHALCPSNACPQVRTRGVAAEVKSPGRSDAAQSSSSRPRRSASVTAAVRESTPNLA